MDARPSDALRIAVRTHAPIFVATDVMETCGSDHQPLPEALTTEAARTRAESGVETPSTAFTPVVEPTHMLIDAASNGVATLLRFPSKVAQQPEIGTLVTIGTSEAARQYRVVAVEAAEQESEGLIRLPAELVTMPSTESSVVVTSVPPPQR
jgi:hypothetical protein